MNTWVIQASWERVTVVCRDTEVKLVWRLIKKTIVCGWGKSEVCCVCVCVYSTCMSTPHSLMTGTMWQSSLPLNAQRQYSTRWPLQRSQVSPKLRTAEVSLSTQYTEKTHTHTGTQNVSIHVKYTRYTTTNYCMQTGRSTKTVKWCWLWWWFWQGKKHMHQCVWAHGKCQEKVVDSWHELSKASV